MESDAKTDSKMAQAASKTFEKSYSLLNGNQCTRVVTNALNAGGFRTGETITYKFGTGMDSTVPAWLR